MPATRSDLGRRLLPVLFWTGVALAPFAALALLLGRGGGPLRVAAVLAITSVVLMGLSVMLRQDVQSLRIHMEETMLDEVDVLREDIRNELRQSVQGEVVAAMRAVQAAREREVAMLQARLEAIQGQIEAPPARRRRELPAGSTPAPTPDPGHQAASRVAPPPPPPAPTRATPHTDVPRPRGGHIDTPAASAGRHHAPDAAPPPRPVRSHQAPDPGSAHPSSGNRRAYEPADSRDVATPRRRAQTDTHDTGAHTYQQPRHEAPPRYPHHATPPADPWHDLRDDHTTHLGTRRSDRHPETPDHTTDLGTRRSTHSHAADDTTTRASRRDDNRYGHLRLVETGPDIGRHTPTRRPTDPPPTETRDPFWTDPLRAPIPLALPNAETPTRGRHSLP